MKILKGSLLLVIILVLLVGLMTAAPAEARFRGHGHANVFIWGGGWGGWPWWGGPYYDPYWYGPGYYPYYYPDYYNYAPTTSYIKTDVDPEEAEVYLDGKKIGIADDYDGWPSYLKVTPGKHHLVFKLKGYEDLTIDVDAVPGRIHQVDYKMFKVGEAPPPAKESKESKAPEVTGGTLRLRLTPADAKVLVDGAPAASTTSGDVVEVKGLAAGKHKIEVQKEGYKSFSFEVTLENGSEYGLGVTLKKLEAEKSEKTM